MDRIYLVIIDLYRDEENSIVNICKTREKAEELMNQYIENGENEDNDEDFSYHYHIDEVDLNSENDILWDCYDNSIFQLLR